MRSLLLTMMVMLTLATASPLSAQQYAGYAQREYRGRTYIYQPIVYYAPVWYAGNGVVKTRSGSSAPVWPGAQVSQVVRY